VKSGAPALVITGNRRSTHARSRATWYSRWSAAALHRDFSYARASETRKRDVGHKNATKARVPGSIEPQALCVGQRRDARPQLTDVRVFGPASCSSSVRTLARDEAQTRVDSRALTVVTTS
jgi:hypothetical protein